MRRLSKNDPPTNPFPKGNQLGKLSKGVPKSPIKKVFTTELLQFSHDQFTEEKIQFLINQLSARDQLQFYIKVTEMLMKRQADEVQLTILQERLNQLQSQINPIQSTDEIIISYIDPELPDVGLTDGD